MSNQSEAKETASKAAMGKHHGEPSGQWCLHLDPEMRKSAKEFRSALLRIEAVEEGEFPEPPITKLTVRLVFHGSLEGSRAADLIQIVGAAWEENIAADAMRFRKLAHLLKTMEKEAEKNQIAATVMSARLQWNVLLRQIQVAQTETQDLGEPSYHNPDAVAAGSLPEFMSIWPERAKYTARLAELEATGRTLGNDLKRQKQPATAGTAAIRGPTPRPIELPSMEAEVGVRELFGGPLCRLVAKIGKTDPQATSLSQAMSIPLSESWWELVKAYHELHLESGLVETHLIGIGEPEEDSHSDAIQLLECAYKPLLEFVKLVVRSEMKRRKANHASSVSARSAGESTAYPPPTQVAPAAQTEPTTTQGEHSPPQTEPRPTQQVAPSNEQASPSTAQVEQPPVHAAPSSTQVAPNTPPEDRPSQPVEPGGPKVASRLIQFDEVTTCKRRLKSAAGGARKVRHLPARRERFLAFEVKSEKFAAR